MKGPDIYRMIFNFIQKERELLAGSISILVSDGTEILKQLSNVIIVAILKLTKEELAFHYLEPY